jgi:hypothetical protein
MELELFQDVMDVVLHGLDLDLQTHGDLFIAAPLLDQRQDLAFARGEMRQVEALHQRLGVSLLRNLGEEQRNDFWRAQGLARHKSPNVL